MLFRKKPEVVNAIRWTGRNLQAIWEWAVKIVHNDMPAPSSGTGVVAFPPDSRVTLTFDFTQGLPSILWLDTGDRRLLAPTGTWIVMGTTVQLWDDQRFREMFDPAEDDLSWADVA